jgi:uncharacterized protein YukE
MTGRLCVDVDGLIQSATWVTGHGDDLQASHAAASTRISAAAGGWAGRSAQALADRVVIWDARTAEIVATIGDHAGKMRTSATAFQTNEDGSAEILYDVASRLPNSI